MNELLAEYTTMTDRALLEYLPKTGRAYSYICDAMEYSLLSGGKRVRPVLVLEFCRLCTGDIKMALPFAAAVEYIHTYSLIHDDLPCMDDDDVRRGRPASHIQFGEANALLAGDALLTHAFVVLCEAENLGMPARRVSQAVRLLSERSGVLGMIGGQYIDLSSENKTLTVPELVELDTLKTGALITLSCELGCVAAGADNEQLAAARVYAQNLGLAFQITDDILDATATTKELGKPAGSDSGKIKATYFSLLGERAAREKAEEYTGNALSALEAFNGDTGFLEEFTKSLLDRRF